MRLDRMCTMIAVALISQGALMAAAESAPALPPNAIKEIRVLRCETNPLITPGSSVSLGRNINGPSVIRVPSWVKQPLGKYYMYFANHSGGFIRLAYADKLEGPWQIHEPGALKLEQAKSFESHIASPDVHVDEEKQEIRMYFHAPSQITNKTQKTGVATSSDGLTFVASDALLGEAYFRVFRWKEYYYALAKVGNTGWGNLSRSKDGVTPFETRKDNFIGGGVRHSAVMIQRDQLLVFYSHAGDAPERIVVATVKLTDDWKNWKESEPIDVIQPEKDYEGISYPNTPSEFGIARNVRQLRDPGIFQEDGHTYLFYSIAGESGIAMAELEITMKPDAGQ